MTTTQQSEDFAESVVDASSLLEYATDWIKSNLEVEDVFNEDDIISYVGANVKPEDVYTEEELEEWAKDNGWVDEK